MKPRILGTDLRVSPVGLGYTFFDTAECYTGTNPDGSTAYNEELVGAALKPYYYQHPIDDALEHMTMSRVFGGHKSN